MTFQPSESITIILTSNFDLVKNFIPSDNKFIKSINRGEIINAALKDKNTKVYSTREKDNRFLSLKHSISRTKEGEQSGLITLEILDYDSLFDLEFLTFNITKAFKDSIFSEKQYAGTNLSEPRLSEVNPELARREKEKFQTFLKSSLKKSAPLSVPNSYFLTYGVGDDISSWAGPFRCSFAASRVDLNGKGVRVITLDFIPSYSPFGLSLGAGRGELDVNTYSHRWMSEYSKEIDVKNWKTLESYDFTEVVHEIVTGYINSIYAGQANVIVLLPEIKIALLSTLESIFRKYEVRSSDPQYKVNRKEFQIRKTFKEIFKLFGFDVEVGVSFKPFVTPYADFERFVSGKTQETILVEEETLSIRITMRSSETDGTTNFKSALDKIEKGYAGAYQFKLIEETNIKVLDLLKKYDFIKNEREPVIIFGPEEFIAKLIYGKYLDFQEYENAIDAAKAIYALGNEEIYERFNRLIFSDDARFLTFSESLSKLPKPQSAETFLTHVFDVFNITFSPELEKTSFETNRQEFLNSKFSFHNYVRKVDLKFFEKSYQEEIANIVLKNIPRLYNENEPSTRNPFFDSGVLPSLKEHRFNNVKSYIPVLRTNVKNSNVLEYSFNFDRGHTGVIMSTMQRLITDFAAGIADETYYEDIASPLNLRDQISELASKFEDEEFSKKLTLLASELTGTNITPVNKNQLAKIYSTLISLLAKRNRFERPFFQINDYSGRGEVMLMYNILKEQLKYILSLRVRTLPMFYLSNYSDIMNRPYLFIGNVHQPVGYDNKRNSHLDSYISDFYLLAGFSHFITNTDCYSEFDLVMPGSVGEVSLSEKRLVGSNQ